MREEYDKKLWYIMLSQMKGIGSVMANRLLKLCGGIDNCFGISRKQLEQKASEQRDNNKITKQQIENFVRQREDTKNIDRAKRIIDKAKEKEITIITRDNPEYPRRFLGKYDMPVLLYIKGRLRVNSFEKTVGIVGSRRCSQEGKENAIQIASKSDAAGYAVISGMAKGIDSYAHTAAIKADGYTVTVLGCGADICYPHEHEKLYDAIVKNGCILSEYPPGMHPRSYMFPNRNRLIAALSNKLYVIDAGRHSGTESTVEFCKRYGMEVNTI